MSRALIRAAIATAADSVAGVTCTPYPRQTTIPGEAWVSLVVTEWPNRLGSITTWRVWVMLPQDDKAAEERADELTDPLAKALHDAKAFTVRRIVYQRTTFENGQSVPTLYVEGTRED